MDLSELERRLEAAVGLDPATLGATVFRSAIDRRRTSLGQLSLEAYLNQLQHTPAELQALIEELVVHESWFLRHPQAFTMLQASARAQLASRRSAPFRVLSIPCAGGEEPYSIALTLLEAGMPADRFEIDAADVSQAAIDRARAGVYTSRALRGVSEPLRKRYFSQNGTTWSVRPILKSSIRFLCANGLALARSGLVGPYDVVFCRNLLIYQTQAARQKLIVQVRDALAPEGLLFVGHAEMLPQLETDFVPVPHRGAFAFRRRAKRSATAELAESAIRPNSSPPGSPPQAIPPAAASRRTPRSAPLKSQLAQPSPSGPELADGSRLHPPVPADTLPASLTAALELANQKRFDEAIAVCRESLSRTGPQAQTYYVLGAILSALGRLPEARQALEHAVYLKPDYEDALLILALIAQRNGDPLAASRYRSRARRAHQRNQKP
ncbi:MAG: putative biofilm formation methyltransferase WspC [Isosphaeraceae bacterium]|jgi:chemotaxis protein methyltransferase WspC|nr:MAG: putative biofilm formation methyltransferase WspC [Isosphaeraceae bacterium]